ncbi:MAG: hypothetical protein O3A60_05700, partial [Planctomycetota bacterium]|nr:hypothetical protein [Planctomycetota bacterium]
MLTSVAFIVMENQSIHRSASPNDAPKRRKLSSFSPVAAIPSLNAAVSAARAASPRCHFSTANSVTGVKADCGRNRNVRAVAAQLQISSAPLE